MAFLVIMFLVLGLLMCVMAVPMMLGKVKPNAWYGFRTPTTMTNPDIWYPANALAGRYLFGVGAIFTLAAALFTLVPGIDEDSYAYACVAVLFAGLLLLIVRSFVYLNKLKKERGRQG